MHYRHYFAAMTAAALLLTGCQKPPADLTGEGITAQTIAEPQPPAPDTTPLTTIVRSERVGLPDNLSSIYQVERVDDGIDGFAAATDDQDVFLHISNDLQTVETAVLTPPAGEGDFFLSERHYAKGNDEIWAIAVMESHGGLEPYDPETARDYRNYDFDAWNNACEFSYLLCRYAKNGTLVSTLPVDGITDYKQDRTCNVFESLHSVGGELYLGLQDAGRSRLLHIDKETGKVQEFLQSTGKERFSSNMLLSDRDGKVLRCCISANELDEFYRAPELDIRICEYDPAADKDGAELYRTTVSENLFYDLKPGFGDYRFFVTYRDAYIGIKDDGTQETLIDWDASDLVRMDVVPLSETQFFAYEYDRAEAYRLTRKHESEQQEEEVLTLGLYGGCGRNTPLYAFVKQFNREHAGIRIELEDHPYESVADYDVTNANSEKAYAEFRQSVLSDDAPDLVLTSSHLELDSFRKQGALLDLSTFLDQDALFNRNTLVSNVVTALESSEDGLYGLPTSFSVETITAKQKICDKENWTLNDMIALYDNADHDVYKWQTKDQIFAMLLDSMDFVDEQTGTAHFDSPKFIKLLEFANRFPAQLREPTSSAAKQQYYMDEFLCHSRDEAYLAPYSFSSLGNSMACGYSYAKYFTFGGEEISFVGYPSDNGQGGRISVLNEMAVTSHCTHPQLAWEFLKAYLQSSPTDPEGLSIIDTQFEQDLDECMYVRESDDEEMPYYEDGGMKVYPMTQEERERVERYIRSCKALMPETGNEWDMIYEESENYFSGGQTAEETAQHIQKRVTQLLAEIQ